MGAVLYIPDERRYVKPGANPSSKFDVHGRIAKYILTKYNIPFEVKKDIDIADVVLKCESTTVEGWKNIYDYAKKVPQRMTQPQHSEPYDCDQTQDNVSVFVQNGLTPEEASGVLEHLITDCADCWDDLERDLFLYWGGRLIKRKKDPEQN